MKKILGFSLIELMVVIAIVAILAAVAAPAYKNYVTKAKLAGAMTIVNDYIKKSTQYYTVNNVFANAQEIGMPLVGADPHIGNGNAESSILANVTMADGGSGHACPTGSVLTEINTSELGDSSITAVYIYNYMFEINGIIRPYCLYSYVIDNVRNGPDLLIDNCVNMFSQTTEANQIQAIIDSCA